MKKCYRIALIFFVTMIFLLVLLAVLLSGYYRDSFFPNTWINGVYCTGKTVEEINEELLSSIEEKPISIIFDEDVYSILPEEIEYRRDFTPVLKDFMQKQNGISWLYGSLSHKDVIMYPQVQFSEEKLYAIWMNIPYVNREMEKPYDLEIVLSKDGYQLIDHLVHRFDLEHSFDMLSNQIAQGMDRILLSGEEFFFDKEPNEQEAALYDKWESMEAFLHCPIIYDMGDEKIPLSPAVMSTFLREDSRGNYEVDSDGIVQFVEFLAEEYDTYNKSRKFLDTKGEYVEVKKGTYGTLIDREAEIKYLESVITFPLTLSGEQGYHVPAYLKETAHRGKNDIGNTYIEINMTDQKLYYYMDGVLKFESDVVTGNTGRRMGTPEGTFYVYGKQQNRVLRGPGYASFVKFWMPVKGSVGIHDANWRSEFGGEIYKSAGSHGCINVPREQMAELYDMVEIGTPVLLFYEKNS